MIDIDIDIFYVARYLDCVDVAEDEEMFGRPCIYSGILESIFRFYGRLIFIKSRGYARTLYGNFP